MTRPLSNLVPSFDYLIVAPLAQPTISRGGIVTPGTARERPQHGIVVAIGPGALTPNGVRTPITVDVDDLVYFGKYAGFEFEHAGRRLLVMRDREAPISEKAGTYGAVVEHDDPAMNHLADTPCEICAAPDEASAKSRLESLREQLASDRARLASNPPPTNEGLPAGDETPGDVEVIS